ncbi:hypothetical protein [Lactiplantibacillus plantarum]|uniref:hypothetical protein n=1 Tax=Lactiplantibacillus plantarum TaxID=1590 RepID=UPI001BAD0D86|nr:hypothetical protein [Lactiplantibacillus plantarum]MBS0954971.1 hypothetical protein [Lactiplantibacillus plantarum]
MTKEQGNTKLKDLYRKIKEKKDQTDEDSSNNKINPLKKEATSSKTNNTDQYWITYGNNPVRTKLVSFEEAINIQNVYHDVTITSVSKPPIEQATSPESKALAEKGVSDKNPIGDSNPNEHEARHSKIDALVEIPDVVVKNTLKQTTRSATKKRHHGKGRGRKKTRDFVEQDEYRVTLPDEADSISETQLLSAVMRSQNQLGHIETDESKFGDFKTVPVTYFDRPEKKHFSLIHFLKGENLSHPQEQVS